MSLGKHSRNIIKQSVDHAFEYINRRISTVPMREKPYVVTVKAFPNRMQWNQIHDTGVYVKPVNEESEGCTLLLMKGRTGRKLGWHKHPNQVETVFVARGSIRDVGSGIDYPKGTVVKYGKGEAHDIEFLEETILVCEYQE